MKGRIVLLLLALVAACTPAPSGAIVIHVDLADDHITISPGATMSGLVIFNTFNRSTGLVHEIEVFAGATAGAVLPIVSSVADTTGLDLIDEIENLVPGGAAQLTLDLAPGTYLLICNLPGHYGNGMRAYLTLTGG